jgi:hypothetical protein
VPISAALTNLLTREECWRILLTYSQTMVFLDDIELDVAPRVFAEQDTVRGLHFQGHAAPSLE